MNTTINNTKKDITCLCDKCGTSINCNTEKCPKCGAEVKNTKKNDIKSISQSATKMQKVKVGFITSMITLIIGVLFLSLKVYSLAAIFLIIYFITMSSTVLTFARKPNKEELKAEINIIRSKEDNNLSNEEIAKLAGLDVKFDMVFNASAEPIGLFAGEVSAEFRKGVELAKAVYATAAPTNADIVVANNYFKSNEASLALGIAVETVREGGTIVLIAHNPEGQVPHYSVGKWGKAVGGALFNQRRRIRIKPKYRKLIIYSPHKQRDPTLPIGNPEDHQWIKTWKEVIEELQNTHPSNPTIAVYPTAEVQLPMRAH